VRLATSVQVLGWLAVAATASADTVTFQSGLTCTYVYQSALAPEANLTFISGASNSHTSLAIQVYCPVTAVYSSSFGFGTTTIYYRDGNNDTGFHPFGGGMEFYLTGIDKDGDSWVDEVGYSCSTAGGCSTDSSPGFVSSSGTVSYVTLDGVGTATDYMTYGFYALIPYSDSFASQILGYSTVIDE
jgi:hypothetical protein